MEMASLYGRMGRLILENLLIIILKDLVLIYGLMGESIKVDGEGIKCMEMEFFLGKMVGSIRGCM